MWPFGKKKAATSPVSDPTSLGNILVEMGVLTLRQLENLVEQYEEYKRTEILLGQFLLKRGVINDLQLQLALMRQQVMRGETDKQAISSAMKLMVNSEDRVTKSLDNLNVVMAARHGR